jgi:hypothetical protein
MLVYHTISDRQEPIMPAPDYNKTEPLPQLRPREGFIDPSAPHSNPVGCGGTPASDPLPPAAQVEAQVVARGLAAAHLPEAKTGEKQPGPTDNVVSRHPFVGMARDYIVNAQRLLYQLPVHDRATSLTLTKLDEALHWIDHSRD